MSEFVTFKVLDNQILKLIEVMNLQGTSVDPLIVKEIRKLNEIADSLRDIKAFNTLIPAIVKVNPVAFDATITYKDKTTSLVKPNVSYEGLINIVRNKLSKLLDLTQTPTITFAPIESDPYAYSVSVAHLGIIGYTNFHVATVPTITIERNTITPKFKTTIVKNCLLHLN